MNIAYTRALERESAGLLKQMENESERNEHAWYHRRHAESQRLRVSDFDLSCSILGPSSTRRTPFASSPATLPTVDQYLHKPNSEFRTWSPINGSHPFASSSSPATPPTVGQYLYKQIPTFGLGALLNASHPLRLLIVARNAADCQPIPVQTILTFGLGASPALSKLI
ncbi:hypothetical protein B0H17DRAFT_1214329 [Mycena rosella]|uniref:Uncharacterized protein n=1 Tax=Mycena rosella TaxID=1033263 RepID=A0AAD7CNA9_MYCRO|nr:hypothetical protein B0H17DRAFT_1214329 [Mycena rosella]